MSSSPKEHNLIFNLLIIQSLIMVLLLCVKKYISFLIWIIKLTYSYFISAYGTQKVLYFAFGHPTEEYFWKSNYFNNWYTLYLLVSMPPKGPVRSHTHSLNGNRLFHLVLVHYHTQYLNVTCNNVCVLWFNFQLSKYHFWHIPLSV